jgi:hypothetical protein
MNRTEFEARLEESTLASLKVLDISLTPSDLWQKTEILEDSVKAVLGYGRFFHSVGWEYADDSDGNAFLIVALKEARSPANEKEFSKLLDDLMAPNGDYAWMNPTRGYYGLVSLTIPLADANFTEFAEKIFVALDTQLEKRFNFKLGEKNNIFEVFESQHSNLFASYTDLLEHVLLEVVGYKSLPEHCSTEVGDNTLTLSLKSHQDSDPGIFRTELQSLCKQFDGIQFGRASGNRFDCSLHISKEVLEDSILTERFFSTLKNKLKDPELNRIYSEWSTFSKNTLQEIEHKKFLLGRLRAKKASDQELPVDLSFIAKGMNLIINGTETSFTVSGKTDLFQEKLEKIAAKLVSIGISPDIRPQGGDVVGNRTVETRAIYNYHTEQLRDFVILFEAISRNEPTFALLQPLTQKLLDFNKNYAEFLEITGPRRKATLEMTRFNKNLVQPLTASEINLVALNKSWDAVLQLTMSLLDYKESIGVDSSISVLEGLLRSLPPVDHYADEAVNILDNFAEDLMPIIKKIVCENQAGAKAAWELYIHLLGQANNIVKYRQANTKTEYHFASFKNLIPFYKEFSCREQLEVAFLIAYIASGDVEGAKKFFYGHEKFADYKSELQEMTLNKFDSLIDKVKQMDLKAFFDGSLSFKVLLLGLFVDRREYLGQLVQLKESVNTWPFFYKTASHVSGSTATNVIEENVSRNVTLN